MNASKFPSNKPWRGDACAEGGKRLWRMRRERTLRSARQNSGGNASSTLATGKGGDLKSDVSVQAYSAGACVYSTPTAEAGTYLSGFTESIESGPELAFYGRGGDSSVAFSSRSF